LRNTIFPWIDLIENISLVGIIEKKSQKFFNGSSNTHHKNWLIQLIQSISDFSVAEKKNWRLIPRIDTVASGLEFKSLAD
jgi:hypothetical protein